jgi:hypothetical protein
MARQTSVTFKRAPKATAKTATQPSILDDVAALNDDSEEQPF